MAPPKFTDLNKQVSDIFNKGYFFNVFKLDVKTRTANGVNFNVVGEHNTEASRTSGSLETKYVVPEYGLTFLEKWNTDNLLKCEITADNRLAEGFKVVFDASLVPNTGKKTAELRTAYTHDKAHVETNVAFDKDGPILNGALVLGHQGWLAGYQYIFNTARSTLTKNNFAVGFKAKDFTLFANMNDGNEVGGSVYQRINDQLETGVQLAWTAGSNQTRFALASKYQLDSQTLVSAKVNNICQVGLSFQQLLRPGVKLTLSALFEAKNLNAGGHKVGFGLELDA
ncbi:unnamed protein product [Rotaria magnacalcarata]|uniref:Voltage-dependent anion-selective channel protein 3 n=2 Tax=Rotaria magnacalcarata TaxID=392030 RepID=A0A816QJC6_9BILA|nr:unnamed protein product [Rotaria magnacalcarata]CAF1673454.1 unnamed protein product [Rotaria magnacalcarata]CAF2005722.1 unnamed protein product [Rotaria magnacalcarata]CAF2028332.1 unnamed protein product [Rotaria magnacalcarata]CAF2062656.1 unnamed protein product [Rotaria magnacalcarata]